MNNSGWAYPHNQQPHYFRSGERVAVCHTAVVISDEFRMNAKPNDACERCAEIVKQDSEIEPVIESDEPKPKRKPKRETSDE